uniref:Ammonium permease MEPA n=1 Tax=Coccidioides posadasii RMSCC 3488 TaxID=454284 RepID=A0A0J6I8W0_COCPO|nr:ammonium permease MEPA [Coccidioides posadasii RMSCC 3488]
MSELPNLSTLNYTVLVPYNGSIATGGNSMEVDLNVFYNAGDITWIITCAALVLLMIPGVGFFYSGLARRKSALSLIWLSVMSLGVVSFQWFFWGYSLAFSHSAGAYIGNLENFGFKGVLAQPSVGSSKIPDILFALYQGMFAAIIVALAVGAVAEHGRMAPCIVFMFIWTTIIYDPLACWTWNSSGWIYKMGGLDFAGGTPVHIASGVAALAYSLMLGKRRGQGTSDFNHRPHNVTHVVIGTGLVAITPGSGYVPPWAAVIFGLVGATACNYATKLKYLMRIDDFLDIFAVHGVGGIIGNLLTGLFAADYIARLDGATYIDGGWLNKHYIQLAYQLADSVTGAAYSFIGSCIILFLINLIPGLHLRASEKDEIIGVDDAEIGEFAYDYVEIARDVSSGFETDKSEPKSDGDSVNSTKIHGSGKES